VGKLILVTVLSFLISYGIALGYYNIDSMFKMSSFYWGVYVILNYIWFNPSAGVWIIGNAGMWTLLLGFTPQTLVLLDALVVLGIAWFFIWLGLAYLIFVLPDEL